LTLNRVIAGTVGLYEEAELTFKRSLAAQMQMQDTQVVSLPLCCCCAFYRPNFLSELLPLRNGRCFYAIELLNTWRAGGSNHTAQHGPALQEHRQAGGVGSSVSPRHLPLVHCVFWLLMPLLQLQRQHQQAAGCLFKLETVFFFSLTLL
jgi:hypothetical protein